MTVGCGGNGAIKCNYKVGDVEKVRWQREHLYKNWVEMKPEEKSQESKRNTTESVTMTRKVVAVEADGSALIDVTIEQAEMALQTDVQKRQISRKYLSTDEKTVSDWPGNQQLAGSTYQIKVAPDTTVIETIGLEELRDKLGLSEDDRSIAGKMLDEEYIKNLHEREFVKYGPKPAGQSQKDLPIPDVMIKAKAIKKTFKAAPATNGLVAVTSTGDALYALPEGMEETPQPNDFGQSLIKDKSDMNELSSFGTGVIDLAEGKVQSEDKIVACSLILAESKVFAGANKKKDGPEGMMFTEIRLTEKFERLE